MNAFQLVAHTVVDRQVSTWRDNWYCKEARRIALTIERPSRMVSVGVFKAADEWWNHPDWLRSGTSFEKAAPLPSSISVAEDLQLMANVLANQKDRELFTIVLEGRHPKFSPGITTLAKFAPDLKQAFSMLAEFSSTLNPYFTCEVREDEHDLVISCDPQAYMGGLAGFIQTFFAAMAARFAEMHLGHRMGEARLVVSDANLTADVPFALEYHKGTSELRVPRDLVAIPNPASDPELWTIACNRFANEVQKQAVDTTLTSVRAIVRRILEVDRRAPRLKQVAFELGISSRTLSRRLADRSATFQEIVESERKSLACVLMADPSLTLGAIAEALGFPDSSSFARSFQKWSGMSPGKFRANGKVLRLAS